MKRHIFDWLGPKLRVLLRPVGLTGRALGPAALALALLLVVWIPVGWSTARGRVLEERTQRAGTVAASIALGIEGEEHESWRTQFKVNQEIADWSAAPRALRGLREGMGQTSRIGEMSAPVSTLRLREQARDSVVAAPGSLNEGALERMITTAASPRWRERVDYLPEMELAFLQGEAVTSGIRAGTDGRSVFGWAPIFDGFGAVMGIVQVEAPVSAALASVFRAHALAAGLLLVVFGGALGLGLRRCRRTARALSALGETASAGDVEEPYLADDTTHEILALTIALEERRAQETSSRAELTADTARARQVAARASRDLHGHERMRHALSESFPTALRRLASAVGRVQAGDVPEAERGALRESVLKTCELARVLDQHRELAELRSGSRALSTEKLKLSELVERAVAGSRERAGGRDVDLRVVIGDGIPDEIEADREVLQRCIATFTENAVQAVARAGGGSVSLRVKRLTGTSAADIRFELCDSAPGLSEAETDTLFDPFPTARGTHRRREHALDASLCVARELLQLHGADVTIDSVPGSGTRMAFTMAFRHAAPAPLHSSTQALPTEELEEGTIELELGTIKA